MIKLLIIGSSALMRRRLGALFDAEGDFEISQARNGKEALEESCNFQPDVIILDFHLLEMKDIATLSLLITQRPASVVALSSFSDKEMRTAFEMLNLDRVSYITRPKGNILLIWHGLLTKVRTSAFFHANGNKEGTKHASED